MACQCAPAITAELLDWCNLGGTNSGCCGNAAHTYGFHCPADRVPATDYSRRRDPAAPNAPVNWSYACAGDFGHGGRPALRERHATVLARLMRGELPMICEFIGQPWPNKPVYYWARWNGVSALQRYTGSGHDTWSHISWYRSRANQRAHLWTPGAAPQPVGPTTPPTYPGYVLRYNPTRQDTNVATWQRRMAQRGWNLTADGYFGDQTLTVVRAFQAEKRLGVDGDIGPITWAAAWATPVT